VLGSWNGLMVQPRSPVSLLKCSLISIFMYDSFSDLLKCDYILTSGSTFALMAAWLSNARVLDVSDIATDISIKAMKYDEWSKHDNFLLNWK
jgi:hypothetical protein